jgi:hypothetical protein
MTWHMECIGAWQLSSTVQDDIQVPDRQEPDVAS